MKNLYKLLFCLLFLTCSSGDENDSNEIIDLTVSISANLSSLTFENTMVSQTSIPKVIIINAENATSEITVTAPDGYEVSVNNTFSSSISFQPEISNEIYVRFVPSEPVNYYSTLQISSEELGNNINVNLFGIGRPLTFTYQAFNSQSLGFGGGFNQSANQTFNLHDDLSEIREIKMFLQIDCPNTGCDDWDRFANIKVKDQSTGNWYEIGRYITPYWVGTQQLSRGLEFDVTDFKSFLIGPTELMIYIENWTAKADIISVEFDYVAGTPDYPYYAVSEVYNLHSNSISGIPYGVDHNIDLNKSIQMPGNSESSHLRTIISGWGHATPNDTDGRPCAEWCFRTHDVKINGSNTFQHYMEPIGCSSNPVSNQSPGNWQPDRAGWCPGMVVPVRTDDLDLSLNSSTFSFEYDLEDWTSNGDGGNAFYAISTYVVLKSNSEIVPAIIQN
jgi:hypothetical protein